MYIDSHGDKRYKIGLHTHTSFSDGRKTVEEASEIYKNSGYDAIAVTDHWVYHGEDTVNGLLLLSGTEFNTGDNRTENGNMHIVGVGMSGDHGITRQMSRQEIIDRINASGGIAILAHPDWSLVSPEFASSLHGFSAIEIYNTVSDCGESFRPYSGYFIDIMANKGYILPLVADDDVHYYDGSDECKSFVMVKAERLTKENILDAIKKGDFYSTQGPELLVNRDGRHITVECSPADRICFVSNLAWAPHRCLRDKGRTHAEYDAVNGESWLRVEITTPSGDAWSNIISFD